ncbi:hypothetical protein HRG_002199 [Hirsutella rhossiliensis]|uniref:Uncharacterized protein n=1 Tax=Hirsutella rhossiliensis TaxID=111463 RepID=A0A9P8N4N6_9HYPO|nr:uncharacterized protein HRG_02199 [Hirsutella rhossiliensis]KAH0966790.1 hypothetical protein HRG_02199 [Hirsutella rhossiliensis]
MGIEAPIAGYGIETVQWKVEVSPGRNEILNGTVQEVHAQILDINPDWKPPKAYAAWRREASRLSAPPLFAAPGGRPRKVSCANDAAIWWCNDNTHTHTLDTYNKIADSAQHIVNMCAGHFVQWVSGQNFESNNWNTIVRGDDC